MEVLYFDCFSGISGDMMLGALLDLGVEEDVFISELSKLNLEGYEIFIKKRNNRGIMTTDVEIIICEEINSHKHHHNEGLEHKHFHPHRNLKDIEELIDISGLNEKVKSFSKDVFREIAIAEAKVHGKDIYGVHFHEVGAIDSIVDIVGVGICLDILGVDKIYSSILQDGKGFIECRHGMIPVPVPAVVEIASSGRIPIVSNDINTELVTPTGIGIIKCIAKSFGNMPKMIINGIGYGSGKREIGRLNALRVLRGELIDQGYDTDDEIVSISTNIDDMSPEILGFVMEKLLENGALDVYYTPICMKKNRPAVMLTVLANIDSEALMEKIIFSETTGIGLRKIRMKRSTMNRKTENVKTKYGEIRVKVSSFENIEKYAPEYEDCKAAAKKSGMPLKDIFDEALRAYKGKKDAI